MTKRKAAEKASPPAAEAVVEPLTVTSMEELVAQLRKKYGDASIVQLNDKAKRVAVISSGSINIDRAMGVGGYPRGRIIEIYGPESSGKTTLALHACANAQRAGAPVGFVDAEHALDPHYARALGVDTDRLALCQPDYGEQALDVVQTMAESGACALVVVDSVAALSPKSEIEGEMEGGQPGTQARMMAKAMRKLTAAANKTGTTLLFINQIRMKIGVFFGSPETTPGGQALRYFASMRIDVRRRSQIKVAGEDSAPVGNVHLVKVVKNKLAPPFRTAEFDIIYGRGIDQAGDLLQAAIELEVIEQRGGNYYMAGEKIAQGRFTLRGLLEKPELSGTVRAAIDAKLKEAS